MNRIIILLVATICLEYCLISCVSEKRKIEGDFKVVKVDYDKVTGCPVVTYEDFSGRRMTFIDCNYKSE